VENRLDKLNTAYKKAIGEILLKEFSHLTNLSVNDVLIDPSNQSGRVYLTTTPEILEEVQLRRGDIQRQLTKHIKTRYTPKFNYLLDDNYLNKLDELFEETLK